MKFLFLLLLTISISAGNSQSLTKKQKRTIFQYESNDSTGFDKSLKKLDNYSFIYKNDPFIIFLLKKKEFKHVSLLLNKHKDFSIVDSNNASILMWAIEFQQIELVKQIIPNITKPFAKGLIYDTITKEYYGSAMCLAAAKQSEVSKQILEILIEHGGDINETEIDNQGNTTEWTPIWNTIENQDIETLKFLLLHNANPNQCIETYSPLMFAAEKGNLEIIKLLIDNNANILATFLPDTYSNGKTVAAFAAQKGHLAIIQYLDSIDSTLCKNSTVLQSAIEGKQPTIINYLLTKNIQFAPLCIENKNNSLQESVLKNTTPSFFDTLIKKGMPFQSECKHVMGQYEFSMLFLTDKICSQSELAIIKKCLQRGVNPLQKALGDETPLLKALQNGNEPLVLLLLEYSPININQHIACSEYLYYAVKNNMWNALPKLLQKIDLNTNQTFTKKAVQYAQKKRINQALEIFESYKIITTNENE